MNSHKSEPPKITGEIPVSINILSLIYNISLRYMRVKGTFYILIGLTWILFRSPSRMAGIAWLNFLDQTTVGLIWILGGAIAIVTSYLNHDRAKKLGFFFLIWVSAIMGAYFFVSWAAYYLPFISTEGYSRAGITTASYWAYSASAYLMAHVHALSSGASKFTTPEVR